MNYGKNEFCNLSNLKSHDIGLHKYFIMNYMLLINNRFLNRFLAKQMNDL